MVRWATAAFVAALMWEPQDQPGKSAEPPGNEPSATTRPADAGSTLKTPAQADILRQLLGREERPMPIRPLDFSAQPAGGVVAAGVDAEGQPLLLEGTFVVERPGRLVREGGRARFVFHVDGAGKSPRTIEILENQLLEAMEREAEAGFSDFIVSGEITRYRDRNYLIIRKILRRVDHGNLSP